MRFVGTFLVAANPSPFLFTKYLDLGYSEVDTQDFVRVLDLKA